VDELYGDRVQISFKYAGFDAVRFTFPAGEGSKHIDTLSDILEFLAEQRLTRTDLVVALGGGVTGDMAGFAAAIYARGVRFVQVPTTLLAAVDSSVGGKTAVDLPGGKNQAGAFYQPLLVLCDPDTLSTLPEEQYRSGCAEVIKYGMLGDEDFFASLVLPVKEQAETVIARCVSMKRDIVHEDEFDTGLRRLLNLGHSFGHAVEKCSDYTILHGEAVAIGMAGITRAAVARGLCEASALDALLEMLQAYALPVSCDYPAEALAAAMRNDKKLTGSTMHLVVPETVGKCRVLPVPASELTEWLRQGGFA
jgi:3-dehydroquinate synthase